MNKLTYWRAKRNLTVRELAAKSGVSPTTISRIEKGHVKGYVLTLQKLSDALGIDILELADLLADPKTLAVLDISPTARYNTEAGADTLAPALK